MASALVEKEAILETLLRCNIYADTGEFDRFRECYMEDCVIESEMAPTVNGVRAIADFGRDHAKGGLTWRHVNGNHVIRLDGNAAHSIGYLVLLSRQPDGRQEITMGGFYEDRMVKDDGRWKIQHRVIHTGPTTLGDLWPRDSDG
jgi:ketosteroid isomerase-like protein